MKRASYRNAVYWIAANDGRGDRLAEDVDHVSGLVTTKLVADLFDVTDEKVATDIVKLRDKWNDNDRKAMLRTGRIEGRE